VIAPAWAIHLPTAGATCVRLRLAPRGERDPWPFMLAITELRRLGATGAERFRSLGRGRDEPVLAAQELAWHGCPLHLSTLAGRDGVREASIELPSWDELERSQAAEADFWELVDAVAAAVGARHGAIGDGEPLDAPAAAGRAGRTADLDRHLALLLPAVDAEDVGAWRAARYRELDRSGLVVLLR
jgi:hypothetical protein